MTAVGDIARTAPLVMGILNVTPDSFSDGGRFFGEARAIAHGRALFAAGADIVDVGGESTRPGARPVDESEELRRVVPIVEALAETGRVSIDTMKSVVARAAVDAGATLINDVSASLHETAADLGVGWVAMHMRAEPSTMQVGPRYDDVVGEVQEFLDERVAAAKAVGVSEIWIDPGIGFGKTVAHNLMLLRHLPTFVASGTPVVVGTSRKSFLGSLLAASDGVDDPVATDDRIEGSLATATWAFAAGSAMVRVHDVEPTVQARTVVCG